MDNQLGTLGESLFQEPRATELAHMRIKVRRVRRITYDCLNAVVRNDRVVCRLGCAFPSARGGLPLLAVLRGRSSSVCQKCPDHNGEGDE